MARTRTTRARGPRRQLVWADTNVSEAATATQQSTDLLGGVRAVAGSVGQGLTIMGVIIQQNALAAGGTPSFTTAFRLSLIVGTASAEGDLPDNILEPYADWMWNSQYYLGDADTVGGSLHPAQRELRIRSRRKVGEIGESLWLVFQPRLGGATTVAYDAHVRVLLALP